MDNTSLLQLRIDTLLYAGYMVEHASVNEHKGFCLFFNGVQQPPLCTMPKYAWEGAPKVERSVDAAEKHLPLPVEFEWELASWTHGIYGRKWRVCIVRGDATTDDDPIVEINDASLPIGMCYAYRMLMEKVLQHKPEQS